MELCFHVIEKKILCRGKKKKKVCSLKHYETCFSVLGPPAHIRGHLLTDVVALLEKTCLPALPGVM